jgi:hypothetical protein
MKKYKLLKDTPTLKAGIIFVEKGDNFNDYKELVQVVPDGCLNRPWFAVDEINNFDDWFEEIPEEHKRWRAKHNERYWCVDGRGGVYCSTEDGHMIDDYRFDTGSYFKTEEEAKAYKEYIIARQIILDDADGGRFSYGEDNWCPCYSKTFHKWVSVGGNTYYPGTIYFKTQKALQESLEEHKDQWEIVRKCEAGEE